MSSTSIKKKPGRPKKIKPLNSVTSYGIVEEPFINSENIVEFQYSDCSWILQIFSILKSYKCSVMYMRFMFDKIIFYGKPGDNDKKLVVCTFDANKIYRYYCREECEFMITQTNTTIYKIMMSITNTNAYIILYYNNVIDDKILYFETRDNISDINISKNINVSAPVFLSDFQYQFNDLSVYNSLAYHMSINIMGDNFKKIISKYKHFNIITSTSMKDPVDMRRIDFITSVESQTNKCEFHMDNLQAQYKQCTTNNFDDIVILRTNFNVDDIIKYLSVFKKLVWLGFRNDDSGKGGIKLKNKNDRNDGWLELYLVT